jgi:hypothetical protein
MAIASYPQLGAPARYVPSAAEVRLGSWPYENAPADKFACPRIGDTGRSAQAASANQQRKRIKCKFTREGAVEKFEPLLLRSEH